jgi:hypothetical protein
MARLVEDVSARIENTTLRTNQLLLKLTSVEKRIKTIEPSSTIIPKTKIKKFKSRNAYIPSILTKISNSEQIRAQYMICNLPPQLWKMEIVIPDDCVAKYSHPGIYIYMF